ncbi:MAG TPA: hypothetical protein PLF00_05250 [Candidatus Marinimicrobia bacterium]|jgi:hypothetical protein|nr:hypothetical protein [Candidatus Neomarinimicrobiota bacterium]
MRRLLILLAVPLIIQAQSIVGEWSSYTSIISHRELTQVGDFIYIASPGGLVEFNKTSSKFKVYSPNDGLSFTDINCLGLDELGDIWLGMSSPNGEVNIWSPVTRQCKKVINAAELREELTLISAITFTADKAYVAYQKNITWGIMYFRNDKNEYTYIDFCENFPAEFFKINNLVAINNTLWVATDAALFFADSLENFPKGPNNWKVVDLIGQGNITSIIEYDEEVICSCGNYIYGIKGSSAVVVDSLASSIVQLTEDQDGKLIAATTGGIYRLIDGAWQAISYNAVNQLYIDDDGIIWGATNSKGLLKINDGGEKFFIPNSLLDNGNTSLYVENGKLVAASNSGISLQTDNGWYNLVKSYDYVGINDHSSADWNYQVADTIAYVVTTQIYTILKRGEDYFASLYGSYLSGPRGGGLLRFNLDDLENYVVYDTTGGKLAGSAGYGGRDDYLGIAYMALDNQNNLWIANQYAQNDSFIAVLTPDDRWVHFSGRESGNYLNYLVTSIAFDAAGRVWFASEATSEPPGSNGGIAVLDYNNTLFDKSDDQWYRVTTSDGLASNMVYSLAFDLENKLWIMTAGGIQSASVSESFPARVFDAIDYAALTNIAFAKECRIKVDGLNNKWITTVNSGVKLYTYNGIWLNDKEGFTSKNSGLLSDNILDVAFDPPRGLVYISTDKGISVYKSPYAYYGNQYQKPNTFPSPFRIPADQPLTIDGLLQDSEVKIMLLDGTFIRHLDPRDGEVAGQQAYWDGRNEQGKLVSSGVYIFVAYTPDGDTITGKIAVVRH